MGEMTSMTLSGGSCADSCDDKAKMEQKALAEFNLGHNSVIQLDIACSLTMVTQRLSSWSHAAFVLL